MLKLLLLLPILAAVNGMVCPPNECDLVDCAPITACNWMVKKNGGRCGCCDMCVAEVGEGELCLASLFIGVPARSECGPGLTCSPHSRKCVKNIVVRDANMQSKCQRALTTVQHTIQTTHVLGLELPHCDADGTYAGMQFGGSQAYCVTVNGTAIPSYTVNRWEAGQMNCQCARDLYDYQQLGMIGMMFHCAPNGNYRPLQCTGSVCYCVDPFGHRTNNATVSIGHSDSLNC